MEDSPLSDLSFFRFPELTGYTVTNIVALFFLLALAVIATVIVQRWMHRRSVLKEHREAFDHSADEGRLPASVREIMERLLKLSPHEDPFDLFRDAKAFEQAVQQYYDSGPEADFQAVASMRRVFHMNVMNPNLTLVSTRQLQADLPVRVILKRAPQFGSGHATSMSVLIQSLAWVRRCFAGRSGRSAASGYRGNVCPGGNSRFSPRRVKKSPG